MLRAHTSRARASASTGDTRRSRTWSGSTTFYDPDGNALMLAEQLK